MTIDYPFTMEEAKAAWEEWSFNCGPAALAFALKLKPNAVRGYIPGFESKRYTSPTMMQLALSGLGQFVERVYRGDVPRTREIDALMFGPRVALTRVQWDGSWCKPGVPMAARYRHTHWIATWQALLASASDMSAAALDSGAAQEEVSLVFDVNGGVRSFADWQAEIVPAILAEVPRSTGVWWPTHIWRLAQ